MSRSGTRTRVSDARLRKVGTLCRTAERRGLEPWQLVAQSMTLSRSQSFELIRRAVAAGYFESGYR